MTTTPELILYRITADDPASIREVPDRLRPFLDACRWCADGDLHSPALLDRDGRRAEYECGSGHGWTRGYTTPDRDDVCHCATNGWSARCPLHA